MNWYSNTALLAALLAGLIDCQNTTVATERGPSTRSESLVHAAAGSADSATDSDSAAGSELANGAPDPLSDDDEKLTINKIMKLAHKSGLLKKVATGKASDAEIANLHKFYSAMPKLAPPKGEEKSWQEKTAALITASKAAVEKDPKASALLKAATNCAACHKLHK